MQKNNRCGKMTIGDLLKYIEENIADAYLIKDSLVVFKTFDGDILSDSLLYDCYHCNE